VTLNLKQPAAVDLVRRLVVEWADAVAENFAPRAMKGFGLDYDALVLDFHDHYLRGIANRFASEPPVRYFVMGANEWRASPTWPPPASRVETFYLDGAVKAGAPGRLAAQPAAAESHSTFTADPKAPVADPYVEPGAHDYAALATRADVLTFDTGPLADDLTVAGEITAEIEASCDCRDFDLWVRVQDVHPDGRAFNVMSAGNDVLRASYRDPEAGPSPLEPGRTYALRLPTLMTAIRFARGHRIRVQISGTFDPHLSRNLQTGGSEVDSSESRPALITIHHDADRPSRIILPLQSS